MIMSLISASRQTVVTVSRIRGIAREIGVINQLTVTAPEINAVAATIADEKSCGEH